MKKPLRRLTDEPDQAQRVGEQEEKLVRRVAERAVRARHHAVGEPEARQEGAVRLRRESEGRRQVHHFSKLGVADLGAEERERRDEQHDRACRQRRPRQSGSHADEGHREEGAERGGDDHEGHEEGGRDQVEAPRRVAHEAVRQHDRRAEIGRRP